MLFRDTEDWRVNAQAQHGASTEEALRNRSHSVSKCHLLHGSHRQCLVLSITTELAESLRSFFHAQV